MNRNIKIAITVIGGAYTVIVLTQILKDSKTHQLKLAEMRAQAQKRIDAVEAAAVLVNQKILAGDYQGKPITDVQRDLEFFVIAENEK